MASTRCPFCNIAAKYPPILPSSFNPNPDNATITTPDFLQSRLRAETAETHPESGPRSGSGLEPELELESSHAYLILSTESVLAFLDIMPLTRGHVLVTTRKHCGTVGDVGVTTGREVCILVFHLIFVWFTPDKSYWRWSIAWTMDTHYFTGCDEDAFWGCRGTLECGSE